jgi:hypothetical protein
MEGYNYMTDEPQSLNNRVKCSWWGGHNWGKWKEFERSAITRTGARAGEVVGIVIAQERICNDCGYKQLSQQKVML